MQFQGKTNSKTALAVLAAAAVLGACSAGAPPDTTTTTTPKPTAADLVVSVDKTTIADTGADHATVTVTAVDSSRNVVGGVPVTIVPDRNGIVTASGTTTDTTTGTVTGTLGIGSDKSSRTIDVVVTAGNISKTVKVDVSGAQLQATAGSATPGQTATVQYALSDKNGVPIANEPIVVTLNGTPMPAAVTDANGAYPFSYTVPATASVTISATAAGVTASNTITTSSGTTSAATGTVTSASVAANPATINVNAPGSTANVVNVRGLFLGAGNAPVQYVRVRYDLNGDPNGIGGTLGSTGGYVYTDANGVAQTTYTPGTRGSGNQQLTVRACWSETDFAAGTCPHAATASITVAQSGVSISIFNNGKVFVDDVKEVYSAPYTVQVVDSVGQPIKGVLVSGSVDLPRYYRGSWGADATGAWAQTVVDVCDNEDINRNSVLETYSNGQKEDQNNSGKIEPYSADAAITPVSAGSDTTDAFGLAYFNLQYGQNVASWDDFTLTFGAVVSGTEGRATTTGRLLPDSDSFKVPTSTKLAFSFSPYNLTRPNVAPIPVGTVMVTDPATNHSGLLCLAQP
jgi:hypothetical protein